MKGEETWNQGPEQRNLGTRRILGWLISLSDPSLNFMYISVCTPPPPQGHMKRTNMTMSTILPFILKYSGSRGFQELSAIRMD